MVIELGGEAHLLTGGGGDGAGVDEIAKIVAVNAFDFARRTIVVWRGAVDCALVAAEVEGDFLGESSAQGGAGFHLASAGAAGIKEELAMDARGGCKDVSGEIVAEASRLHAYQYRFKAGRQDASATFGSPHPRPLAFQRVGGVWLGDVKER